jgi:hypothetical protein
MTVSIQRRRQRTGGTVAAKPATDTGTQMYRRFVDQEFDRGVVDLDGAEFVNCRFRGTTIRYSGGELPRIIGCSFFNARFAVDGAAARTLQLLSAMSLPGSGLQAVVRETFGALFAN